MFEEFDRGGDDGRLLAAVKKALGAGGTLLVSTLADQLTETDRSLWPAGERYSDFLEMLYQLCRREGLLAEGVRGQGGDPELKSLHEPPRGGTGLSHAAGGGRPCYEAACSILGRDRLDRLLAAYATGAPAAPAAAPAALSAADEAGAGEWERGPWEWRHEAAEQEGLSRARASEVATEQLRGIGGAP
jgi:hypothetical protein